MELKLADRLIMLGVAAVGINTLVLHPELDALDIQKQVFLSMNDVVELEKEIEDRRKKHENELLFKGYKIILK